jgi:hypothetical protein
MNLRGFLQVNKTILVAGLAVAAAGAQAILVIDPTPGNLPDTENVLFNEVGLIASGPLVQGILNQSGVLVDFFDAGEDLITPPGGQARVASLDKGFASVTTQMTDVGLGIIAYQFDVHAIDSGDITVDLYMGGGVAHSGTFAISENGSNWFKVYGTEGEVMDKIVLTHTGDIQDVRQNRIGAAPLPVPEPSALAGLGVGLALLLRRRMKK